MEGKIKLSTEKLKREKKAKKFFRVALLLILLLLLILYFVIGIIYNSVISRKINLGRIRLINENK